MKGRVRRYIQPKNCLDFEFVWILNLNSKLDQSNYTITHAYFNIINIIIQTNFFIFLFIHNI